MSAKAPPALVPTTPRRARWQVADQAQAPPQGHIPQTMQTSKSPRPPYSWGSLGARRGRGVGAGARTAGRAAAGFPREQQPGVPRWAGIFHSRPIANGSPSTLEPTQRKARTNLPSSSKSPAAPTDPSAENRRCQAVGRRTGNTRPRLDSRHNKRPAAFAKAVPNYVNDYSSTCVCAFLLGRRPEARSPSLLGLREEQYSQVRPWHSSDLTTHQSPYIAPSGLQQ